MHDEERTLAANVAAFVDSTAELVGKMAAERWRNNVLGELCEGDMTSPIEQMFWAACHALAAYYWIDLNPAPNESRGEVSPVPGLHILPQFKDGPYRVDFVLLCHGYAKRQPVVVELDGHAFHDKDKQQRAYEKARDRYLVRQGYKVLHFTGSEIVKDPFAAAFEAFEVAGAVDPEFSEFDPLNPLGEHG